MSTYKKFHGSYLPTDVDFLLKVIDAPFTSIEDKERLIQSGRSHYSEMISREYEPSPEYMKVFYSAMERNKAKFAKDVYVLAENIAKKDDIVLVSLVRAGTPIGVLVKRILKERFAQNVPHYSISIIRDREIDKNALLYIREKHPKGNIVFIDGWTGKGVINKELKQFILEFNRENGDNVSDELYVVADIAGVADHSVTNEDYLIPSSTLNSTVSGLVSRSILNKEFIDTENGDFHGCKFYKEFKDVDISLWFVDEIMGEVGELPSLIGKDLLMKTHSEDIKIDDYFIRTQKKYNITNINYIKPGIGESTRVLLRRTPHIVIVKDSSSQEVAHLKVLAKEKNVEVVEDKDLPFTALSIIKEV